jgi:hypothetical protein
VWIADVFGCFFLKPLEQVDMVDHVEVVQVDANHPKLTGMNGTGFSRDRLVLGGDII